MKKDEIIAGLNEFPYGKEGIWLITGAALVLYGVRDETADIDMGCTSAVADRLEEDGYLYKVTEDGNRWFKIDDHIEVFENWLFDRVELHDGCPVMSLKGIREMKQHLGREKDLRDIRLIDDFLSKTGPDKSAG